jgi:hypothetical protein
LAGSKQSRGKERYDKTNFEKMVTSLEVPSGDETIFLPKEHVNEEDADTQNDD